MPKFIYVYILRSQNRRDKYYTGLTSDLRTRLKEHNSGGGRHTSRYHPWEIKTAIAFTDPARARAFEVYLKSASGRAFAEKRL
jgi:predicted GIY-YIG superfamily endonuclease